MAAQFEVLESIVSYARLLAYTHVDIEGFLSGESYELNHTNHTYPLLWLQWPLTITPITDINQSETLRLRFRIGVYVNTVQDEFGNDVVVREDTLPLPANQISTAGLIPQDELIQKSFRIMAHLIAKMKKDIEDGVINAKFGAASFSTVERVTVDDVYGCTCNVEFTLGDPYSCDIDNVFINPTNNI